MARETTLTNKLVFKFFFTILNPVIIISLTLNCFCSSSAYYFEASCSTTKQCNPGNKTNFICWNGICVCDSSLGLVYDQSFDYCLQKPGGICDFDDDCVDNAICNEATKKCVCSSPHFEATQFSECRAKHKSPCNDTMLCNETKFLQCKLGICTCSDQHGMFFDRKKDKCIAKLGHACELQMWMDLQVECVSNAECVGRKDDKFYGICQCKKHFFANIHFCERDVGSPCDGVKGSSSCEDGLYLKCHRGQCECKDLAIFDSVFNQCRLKVASPCNPGEVNHCVSHANCTSVNHLNSEATCQCVDGFIGTSRGNCKAAYGNMCKTSNDCFSEKSALKCLSGVCSCDVGQEYNKQKETCASLVGMPCDSHLDRGKLNCSQNSICVTDDINKIGTCICVKPFIERDRVCVPGYGAPCSKREECPDELGLICSKGGECICHHKMIFNSISNKCVVKAGHHCKSSSLVKCIRNSSCGSATASINKNLQNQWEDKLLCICDKGFQTAPDGRCVLPHGQFCATDNEGSNNCNSFRGLKCINNRCDCEHSFVYNRILKYCVSVADNKGNKMVSSFLTAGIIYVLTLYGILY